MRHFCKKKKQQKEQTQNKKQLNFIVSDNGKVHGLLKCYIYS